MDTDAVAHGWRAPNFAQEIPDLRRIATDCSVGSEEGPRPGAPCVPGER